MKTILTFGLLTIFCFEILSQKKCNCEGFIDFKYNGQVYLYNIETGEVIDSMTHDYDNEDFLALNIYDSNDKYLNVNLKFSISELNKKGWIKKENFVGTYARNYIDGDTLILYSKPDKNSKPESLVLEYTPKVYMIKDCSNDWLYVKMILNDKIYTGWLEPGMQCPSVYTTCN